MVLDALGRPGDHPAVRRLADAWGGSPLAARDRAVGEPPYRSRRLSYASGGELILHDDLVVAVVLHLLPSRGSRGIDLAAWIPGVTNAATLDVLAAAVPVKPRFAGVGAPYLPLDGGFARLRFKDGRGWREPGNLVGITFVRDQPGTTCRPEDDDCPSCSDLLVRHGEKDADDTDVAEVDGAVDVPGTIAALEAAVAACQLTEDPSWVRLADLLPLQESGLMPRVESQLGCKTCGRIACLTLFPEAAPRFGHYVWAEAHRRPLDPIPPVERWGNPTRIAAEQDAMHYVDHEPVGWWSSSAASCSSTSGTASAR